MSVTCGRPVVFSRYSISSTNKTDRHNINEILLKVALNTKPIYYVDLKCLRWATYILTTLLVNTYPYTTMYLDVWIQMMFWCGVGLGCFNATFNNISVIWWQSVLLMEETGENHWQTITKCIMYTSRYAGFELTTLVVIGNYHRSWLTAPDFLVCNG